MTRDPERHARAAQAPIVGSLPPEAPGIIAAMRLAPALATHLRGLADALLVDDFPGATLTRTERELLATAVSAANDCVYCMDSHGAFARELGARAGHPDIDGVVAAVTCGGSDGLDARMTALVAIARTVQRRALELDRAAVERALAAGATDADTQLAVLIAAAFSMYNRMVDGLRAPTPASPEAFRTRAGQIADHGYADARITAVPR